MTAKGWDSASATYTPVAESKKVVGLARTGGALGLPDITGHSQEYAGSCYICHGGNYATGGHNVHSPGSGIAPSHLSESYYCYGPGCHAASADLSDVHAEFVGSAAAKYPQYATTCDLCHSNESPNRIDWTTASMSCSSCHPIYHGVPEGQSTTHDGREAAHAPTVASDACVGCHSGSLTAIHGAPDRAAGECGSCHSIHASPLNAACDKCHSSITVWDKSADCVDCHPSLFDGLSVGAGHYNETTHTATPFTAAVQATGAEGLVATGNQECAICHSPTLKAAHATTSSSGGSVTCAECHNDATLGSQATVAAGWPGKRCVDCHDAGTLDGSRFLRDFACGAVRHVCGNRQRMS